MSGYVERSRHAPVTDFLGISPNRMHRILNDGVGGIDGFLGVGGEIWDGDAASIPLMHATLALLARLGESGPVKATAKGNLPRAFVLDWWDESFGPREENERTRMIMRPNKEDGDWTLHTTRRIIRKAGLIKLQGGEFSVTDRWRKLLAKGDRLELYRALFFATGWDFDWNYGRDDARALHPFTQRSFAFNLYLLGRIARSWITQEEAVQSYLRAFPEIRKDFISSDAAILAIVMDGTLGYGLTHFPIELGLLEHRNTRQGNDRFGTDEYRITPLFDRLLSFSLR